MNKHRIGIIQGRLSPQRPNKIQCFPGEFWEEEFELCAEHNFSFIEWTVDRETLPMNPLNSASGRLKIRDAIQKTGVSVPTMTLDICMESPFFKYSGASKSKLLSELLEISEKAFDIGVKVMVLPLVDGSSVEDLAQEQSLLSGLESLSSTLAFNDLKIGIESDYAPGKLKGFICNLDPLNFGIVYDSGNSASLGYEITDEFQAYGDRILHVHIKDRLFEGPSVRLGTGHVNFKEFIKQLNLANYQGLFSLQTARSEEGEDLKEILNSREYFLEISAKWN